MGVLATRSPSSSRSRRAPGSRRGEAVSIVDWCDRNRAYQALYGAPSRTRTDTWRILSPLPLPIGLWGRCSSEPTLGRFSLPLTFRIPQ